MIFFSLLACFFMFLGGIYVTYDIMIDITGPPENGFSFGKAGQALNDLFIYIKSIFLKGFSGN